MEASVSLVMVGESAPMQQVHEHIRLAAKSKTAVLALGETRTGKAIQGLAADVRRLLVDFCWPGFLVELKDDDQVNDPAVENVKNHEYAIEHFARLNQWLALSPEVNPV